jgi:hypothetical protein
MSRETVQFADEDAQDIMWEEWAPEGFEWVTNQFEDQGDWSNTFLVVVKRLSDGKFFGALTEKWHDMGNADPEYPTEFKELATIPSVIYYIKEK